jgi:hypothetical protein
MPRGFIPDTGKPRSHKRGEEPNYYLLPLIQTKFWQETITMNTVHTDYLWDSEERQTQQTDPTIEINMVFLDDTFDQLPDEAKLLMDITDCLAHDFNGGKEHFSSIYGSEGGSASYEFKPAARRYGSLELGYSWSSSDEGYVYEDEYETYLIPGVIKHNYRYYGLTREFLDWCRTPDKPKRAKWLSRLTYGE